MNPKSQIPNPKSGFLLTALCLFTVRLTSPPTPLDPPCLKRPFLDPPLKRGVGEGSLAPPTPSYKEGEKEEICLLEGGMGGLGRFYRNSIALSLVSLHTTASTLSGAMLLWTVNAHFFAAPTLSQTLPKLPASAQNGGIPLLVPAPPFDPASRGDFIGPIPPLGYPNQNPLGNSSTNFNRYLLGVGDTISVFVQRFPDLSFQAVINTEGNVVVPLVGAVRLVGLTVQQAQAKIRSVLNRYVVNPGVTVTLATPRPAQVTLTGEVIRPGFYPLGAGAQLAVALLAAGGATTLADLRSVIVRRSFVDGSIAEQRVDLFTPLQNGQPIPDLRLQDGDAVIVPKLEVGTQQDYDRRLVSRSTLAQQTINVRVLSYANGGLIGTVSLPNGSTFVDALGAIGANADTANLRKIALIRFDPEQGKAVTQEIDGKQALLGNVAQNVPLQNNDVIVVGRNLIGKITYALSTFTRPFQDALTFLDFLNSLAGRTGNLFRPLGGSQNR